MAACQGDARRGVRGRAGRRGHRPQRPADRRLPAGHRRRRPAGPHGPVRRQGLRHVVDEPGPQLPRLQGDRLHARLRPVDPRHQPGRAAAAGPRRAVADLGHARRGRRDALRRRVRRLRRRADRLTPDPGRPRVSVTSGAARCSGSGSPACASSGAGRASVAATITASATATRMIAAANTNGRLCSATAGISADPRAVVGLRQRVDGHDPAEQQQRRRR